MEGFAPKPEENQNQVSATDLFVPTATTTSAINATQGSSVLDSDLKDALAATVQAPVIASEDADHDHGNPGSKPESHVDLNAVDIKSIDLSNATGRRSVGKLVRMALSGGDFLDPGAGNNTVIAGGGNDIIVGKGGGINTFTTGTGRDAIVLGAETTNRIFDFDPTKDTIAIDSSVAMENIVVAQGKNPGKGGLKQPFDSVNNTLIIDKSANHILGVLTFTKAESLTSKNFVQVQSELVDRIGQFGRFSNTQETGDGGQQLNGTTGRDKMIGRGGDDFLFVGDDGFKIGTAKGGGGTEFPFRTDSPGTSELNAELKGGVLNISGSYKDFDGAPLFSQGETELDPKTRILNGSDPKALIDGFLKVPKDVEGNNLSGTHMHFSPADDSRGNFADATVVRYLSETITDAKSGTFSGQFKLTPEEQAALLAGNLYVNAHTNVDLDGDGEAGFATGENRLNFNQNTMQFTQRSREFFRS
ncbi:hypothetical protein H6F67_21325 [Microcoleus sp. FACHB-1515]|uniref:hypothetical protein n=1 Tax=Cyanophyceae TaxID=3028117 RepID=UPI001688D8DB|nr:hypothetical protein [Microcoleus sp. FACHB-1515]MBD2092395.1 hypothetical protein [Microcoleus sp. FACHB-1515]